MRVGLANLGNCDQKALDKLCAFNSIEKMLMNIKQYAYHYGIYYMVIQEQVRLPVQVQIS